ncbi:MAG: AsmA family protein, partial [Deltaproteobacteria bacterium]|jgi:AsmA protein|nr:AsmA family protein [Deltaproteobacteria bacterium]
LLSQSGHIQLDLQQLNLLAFRPYFADKVPGTLGGMTVDLHTVLDVTQSELSAKGRLDITDLDLTLEALPDAPLQNARVDVDHDLKFNLERGHLDLKQLDVEFNGLPASMSGSLNGLFETPMLNATVQTPGIDLRTAMVAVPTELVSGVKDFDPAGKLKFEAELTGSFDKPLKLLKSALITIENVQATMGGQRPSLDGRVRVVGDQAESEDLKVRLGDNTADLSVKARNFYGKPLIAVLDVKSERFELDPLLRGGGAAALAGNSSPPTTNSGLSPQHGLPEKAVEKDIGPFDIPLTANGSIQIGETVWKGLTVKDFVAHYELKNNILSVSRIDGKLAGGSFHNTAQVDLAKAGLVYKTNLDLRGINADPLVSALFPAASGTIFGAMNLDLAVNGRGTRWEVIRRGLNGSGELMLSDGKMVSPQLVQGFAQILQIPDMNEIVFDSFRSGFNVINGKVNLDGRLDSRQVKLLPKGAIGLDGSLDIALDARLSPEVSARIDQKNQVAKYLTDNEGWSQLPLLLSGTLTSPRFGLDPKGLKSQATKALGKELERQVDKLFQKQQEAQPSQEQQSDSPAEEDPTQKMLKEGLKKLFGN